MKTRSKAVVWREIVYRAFYNQYPQQIVSSLGKNYLLFFVLDTQKDKWT